MLPKVTFASHATIRHAMRTRNLYAGAHAAMTDAHRPVIIGLHMVGVLLVLTGFGALNLAAQDRPPLGDPLRPDLPINDRTTFGVTAGLAVPQASFGDLTGLGVEVAAHMLLLNRSGWLALRLSGSGALYGTVSSPLPDGGRLAASSRWATLDVGPQVMVSDGVVRPYGYAALGGTFALMEPSIEEAVDPVFQPQPLSDITYVFKVGGGVYVPLTSGTRPITLDLGAHYRWNGDTRFLKGENIAVRPTGQVDLGAVQLSMRLIVLNVGVTLGL